MREDAIRQEYSQISKKMQEMAVLLETEKRARTPEEGIQWNELVDRRNVLDEQLATVKEIDHNLENLNMNEVRDQYRKNPDDEPPMLGDGAKMAT